MLLESADPRHPSVLTISMFTAVQLKSGYPTQATDPHCSRGKSLNPSVYLQQ